jgi:hypothetical protein
MSETRDKARRLIDSVLPEGPPPKIITSDGATGTLYTVMTGLSHKQLTDNWSKGGIMTGCNGFVGWYGRQMGSPIYLGGFDLKGIIAKAGKADAWVDSTDDVRPDYGDILRHTAFHVDVCLGFDEDDEDILLRAAGGQGGKGMGRDIIKRVRGTSEYDPKRLMGWIDIDYFFGDIIC